MKKLKVVKVSQDAIEFEGNIKLYSHHDQDCCESHYLDLEHLSLSDFEGLEFDLSGDGFFNRIDGYGIELIPNKGFSVKIAGYGSNNGYYSSDLNLVIALGSDDIRTYDISDCQVVDG